MRGNPGWTTAYTAAATEGMDEIMEQLVRMEQGQVRRIGRQTQTGAWRSNVRTRHSKFNFKEKTWQIK